MSNASCNDTVATDHISKMINMYVPPIMIVLGCTCNAFIIAVMRTKLFRSLSTSVYFTAGAVNDFSSLLIALIPHWLYINFPSSLVRSEDSHYMCKFFNFYGWANTDFGILVISAMTTERAVAIIHPLKSVRQCTSSRAQKTLVLLFVIAVAKQVHFIFASDIVPPDRTERLCDIVPPNETYTFFYFQVWPWIHIAFLLVNFIFIITSNIILINYVKMSADKRTTGQQKMGQIAPLVIIESISIVILTFPLSIHLATLSLLISYGNDVYSNPDSKATQGLLFSITFYMLYSNKVVTFFMYCLAGSRFRQGLKLLMRRTNARKAYLRNIQISSCLVASTRHNLPEPSGSLETLSVHM